MHLTYRSVVAAGVAVVALLAGPAPAKADIIFGLSQSGNQIVAFDSARPNQILLSNTVTGLGGASLVGIDFRPRDNALIGVGRTGTSATVFQINPFTGAATAISTAFTLTGAGVGVDFNPVPNALRIVTDTEQNLRITNGGAGTVFTDTALSGATSIVAAAYSNNFDGATSTILYDIDSVTGQLFIQGLVNPPGPNGGVLTPVGSLGRGTNLGTEVGFDISARNVGFVSIGNSLFTINLATGATTPAGTVGGPPLRDIAVAPDAIAALVPEPATMTVFGALAIGAGLFARRRK